MKFSQKSNKTLFNFNFWIVLSMLLIYLPNVSNVQSLEGEKEEIGGFQRIALNGRLMHHGFLPLRVDRKYDNYREKTEYREKFNKEAKSVHVISDYFVQKLDHFDETNKNTWSQFYMANAHFYRPGGPIFLLIGGEAPIFASWIDSGREHLSTWMDLARKYGAMTYQLEHRFYGKSNPTDDMSSYNLQYLTIRQALADIASFIRSTNSRNGSPQSIPKWVIFGGSYSGALAAWFRLKYPELTVGAVASSAPVLAKVDFGEYFQVVTESLKGKNGQCLSEIKTATDELTKLILTKEGQKLVFEKMRLCTDIDWSNAKDVQNFWGILYDNFEFTVQYNLDNQGIFAHDLSIDKVCALMTGNRSKSGLDRLAAVNSFLMQEFALGCISVGYRSLVEYLQQYKWGDYGASNRLWIWQTCSELGYFQSTDKGGQPFRDKLPLSFFFDLCRDVFGRHFTNDIIYKAVNATDSYYGGKDYAGTNVVLPNGSIDPWHVLGILSTSNPSATTVYIEGTAHCADMYPAREDDLKDLILARKTIDSHVGNWLNSNNN